jgi:hypothetical protein
MRYLILYHEFAREWDFYKESENGHMMLCGGFYKSLEELAKDIVSGDPHYCKPTEHKAIWSYDKCYAFHKKDNPQIMTIKQLTLMAL